MRTNTESNADSDRFPWSYRTMGSLSSTTSNTLGKEMELRLKGISSLSGEGTLNSPPQLAMSTHTTFRVLNSLALSPPSFAAFLLSLPSPSPKTPSTPLSPKQKFDAVKCSVFLQIKTLSSVCIKQYVFWQLFSKIHVYMTISLNKIHNHNV